MEKKISDRIRYVGVNDHTKVIFEGMWPLPFGVSYNSYLVVDEKVALIDTVEAGFEKEYLGNIRSEIGDRKRQEIRASACTACRHRGLHR